MFIITCIMYTYYAYITHVHPLARSNWFIRICYTVKCYSCYVCILFTHICYTLCISVTHHKKGVNTVRKMSLFPLCGALQAKHEILLFRVHPLALSMGCILSSGTFDDVRFSPSFDHLYTIVFCVCVHVVACVCVPVMLQSLHMHVVVTYVFIKKIKCVH